MIINNENKYTRNVFISRRLRGNLYKKKKMFKNLRPMMTIVIYTLAEALKLCGSQKNVRTTNTIFFFFKELSLIDLKTIRYEKKKNK